MAEQNTFQYDPDILAQTSSLKIQAVNLVEGLLSGQHRSPHKGSSVEFAEYKDYSHGDDIRHIDWKVAGKTDKYYVKQFEQSTNLKCTILLDASGSMSYESPNPKIPGLKKQYVIYIRLNDDLKNSEDEGLWSSEAWYTLNNIPESL